MSLCFLGAGDPNRLSWGILIQTGQANALRGWWLACFPGMVPALATVGLALLALDETDPAREDGARWL